MKFTISFLLSLFTAPLFSSALPTASDDKTGLPETKVHYVQVGGANILAYTPAFVFANPGDTIRFDFLQLNHTLTQSSFLEPCTALDGGVNSGFKPNPTGEKGLQTFDFVVPDGQEPLWFYCQQGKHCSQFGMVFAINPTVEKDFTTFFSRAKGLIA